MADRTAPYPAYNFLVDWKGPNGPDTILGGFSDVTGLSTEIHVSEYRNGNDPEPHVQKFAGIHKVENVTCKRGLVNSLDFWAWITQTRTDGANAKREVVITLRDESGDAVQKFKLRGVIPFKWTGPTLSGKGAGDVAMEEIVLSVEGLEIESAP
ncbi:MAG: phage tail protein [Acidobacteriota bacterium]